jgi:uncharacterized protein
VEEDPKNTHAPHAEPAEAAAAQAAPPPPARLAPVRAQERVASVDVLRGLAVLGILGMNIYAFALPWPAYGNPFKGGGTGLLDLGTWWATHLLFEMKFMAIFSMLFGAGLVLMAERAEARGARFGAVYYRRLLWLLLIGIFHAYLMWYGDILFAYAVCGLVLYPLRRLGPKLLVTLGLALTLVTVPIGLGFGFFLLPKMHAEAERAIEARDAGESLSDDQIATIEFWEGMDPPDEKLEEEIAVYRNGYVDQIVFRAPLVLQFQTFFMLVFGVWRIGGLMIVGMGLMKLGVLSATRSNRFYVLCCVIGYGVGLPVVYLGAAKLVAERFNVFYMNQGGYLPNYFGSLLVALGHVGLVMLVCRTGAVGRLTRSLSAVGRMAFTNYLGQTIICTAIFYGWGLGLFAHLSRFALMGVVVAVWIFQMGISPFWLERFRFGPAEWLWRSLTYWRRQSMRLAG